MNLDKAINVHSQWKYRLLRFLEANGEPLDADTIVLDDQCELGKWIHGAGTEFADQGDFQLLRDQHARFHRAAATLVAVANRGNRAKARQMLEAEYAEASRAVVLAIARLKRLQGVGSVEAPQA